MKITQLLIGLLSIILIIVLIFVFQKTFFNEKAVSVEQSVEEDFIPPEFLTTEEQKEYYSCNDQYCFEERFSNCEKAFFETNDDFRVTEYEIIGYEQDLCKIKITVSNDLGDSGETTCLFDNKKSFSEVIENPSSCENINNLMLI